jgi:hypothetical protein
VAVWPEGNDEPAWLAIRARSGRGRSTIHFTTLFAAIVVRTVVRRYAGMAERRVRTYEYAPTVTARPTATVLDPSSVTYSIALVTDDEACRAPNRRRQRPIARTADCRRHHHQPGADRQIAPAIRTTATVRSRPVSFLDRDDRAGTASTRRCSAIAAPSRAGSPWRSPGVVVAVTVMVVVPCRGENPDQRGADDVATTSAITIGHGGPPKPTEPSPETPCVWRDPTDGTDLNHGAPRTGGAPLVEPPSGRHGRDAAKGPRARSRRPGVPR